tara:strand:+ start:69 stop:278 length:210 start_codon:yes stop_codon:yes gene_type:complete
MNINFKSIALSVESYTKLKHLAQYRFEMPQSMAKVVAFLVSKAYEAFEQSENEKHAEETWELVKDFEPI